MLQENYMCNASCALQVASYERQAMLLTRSTTRSKHSQQTDQLYQHKWTSQRLLNYPHVDGDVFVINIKYTAIE